MPTFHCPRCEIRKDVGAELAGKTVRCPRCGDMIAIGPRRRVWWLALLGLVALGAGGGYFLTRPQPSEEPGDLAPVADAAAAERQAEVERQQAEAAQLARQRQQLEADRKQLAEERQQLESDRAAVAKQREDVARESALLKESLARLEAERLQAARRQPGLVATLEDIDRAPEKFMGKLLVIEDALIHTDRIEKHADLGRVTLGVTSRAGKHFSRVPLNGLLISTSEKLAADIGKTPMSGRVRLFGEVRTWSRKGSDRSYPEVHVYRIEVPGSLGGVGHSLEEPAQE